MCPLTVLLDSVGFDLVADDERAFDQVERAVTEGRLVLRATWVQIQERDATPTDARRRRLQTVAVTGVTTAGGLFDLSAFDTGTFFGGGCDDEESAIYTNVAGDTGNHAADALALLTARRESIPLLTTDTRLTAQCIEHGVAVIASAAELLALLE